MTCALKRFSLHWEGVFSSLSNFSIGEISAWREEFVLEREHVLGVLIEEVLGPRNGTFESLAEDFDPKNEYIVGVLAPKQAEGKRDVDAEAVLPDDGDTDEADDDADGDVFTSFSPSLDPKALPRSLGLSFVVLVAGNAKMDVCFTWARYISDGEFWHRNPDFEHFEFDIPTNRVIKSKKDSGIEYTIRTTPIDGHAKYHGGWQTP